jgi:ABC-type antimicrobial peptide transport system permease subunit
MMGMRDVGLYILLFIVFTVAGLAVLNTMLMTVFERTCELGVLRALGMGRLQMMLLVVFECILLTAIATLIGLLIGGVLDWLLLDYGFPYETAEGKGLSWQGVTFPPVIKGLFRIEPVVITVVFMNMVAVVAAVWPAIRAARLRPVEAMRQS